jgi:predicted DNA binding CopG/RHH family protein
MAKRSLRKPLPPFGSEAEEREFWETHDTSPFVDWSQARVAVFPNLKPSTETISLRLPTALLLELKALANKRDVPYQSLLKVFLAERVVRETSGALANTYQPSPRQVGRSSPSGRRRKSKRDR